MKLITNLNTVTGFKFNVIRENGLFFSRCINKSWLHDLSKSAKLLSLLTEISNSSASDNGKQHSCSDSETFSSVWFGMHALSFMFQFTYLAISVNWHCKNIENALYMLSASKLRV